MNKKYIIEVATNKASLQKLKDDLSNAIQTPLDDAAKEGRIKGLTRSEKATIKKDLATLFGVADYQAEALRNMVQAMTEGLADAKSVEAMKNQLKETLEFTTGIMKNMQQMGDATDWMKQGVTFADDFVNMKGSLEKTIPLVTGLKQSVGSLTKSFEKFKDALAETNADAFLQRFGNSTRSEAESLARAQKELQRIAKTRSWSLSNAISSGRGETPDFSGKNQEQIETEYKKTIENIEKYNQKIDQLRQQFKGRTAELYKNNDYINAIKQLSKDMHYLNNMPSHFDGLDGNLKVTLKEATDSVKTASNEIKNIIKGVQGDGIELTLTLPEASSTEFVTKIDKFVKDATKQFKTKPIEIAATVKNPFKDTKTEAGEESNNIADSFTKSIATVKEAINNGYKELRTAVNSENSLLNKELFLKFGYKKSDTDAVITDAIESMQHAIYYDLNPLELNFNTESVAEKLAKDVQAALNNIKMPSIPTTNTGNVPTSAIPVRFVGGLPLKIEAPDGSKQPDSSPIPKKSIVPPAQKVVDEKTGAIQSDNTNAVKTSSEVQRALNKALTSLNATIQAQNNIISRNQAKIDNYTEQVSGKEQKKEVDNLKSDILKLRQQLVEPKKKEKEIRDEQSKLSAKHKQAQAAYNSRYEELSSNDAYKDIKEFDERLRILRANRDETDREYRSQISKFDQKIKDAQKHLGKSKEEDVVWQKIIEDYTNQRTDIENKRQSKLVKLDGSIDKVETERRNALSTNAAAQQITKELEPLALAIVQARKQLNTKTQELYTASLEANKVREKLGQKEEELESKTHSKEIAAAQKEIDAAQRKTDPLSKRSKMIQSILDNNQDPVKLVLDTTNQFWESSAKTIKSAQNSMLKYSSDDAMKTKLKDVFDKQAELESLDPKSDKYKKLKSTINDLWVEINEAAKSLTGKEARNFNVSKSKYDNSYARRNAMALQGLTDMSDLDEDEALSIVTSLLKKQKVTSSRISKISSTPLLKDLSEYVKISKTALGVQDQTDEQYDADVKAQNALLQTARNMELLKRLYKAFPIDKSTQLEKQINQLKEGNYISLDSDTVSKLVGEHPELNIKDIIAKKEAELNEIRKGGKFNRLPDAKTIENFVKAFSGFEEMRDVVESATQYLNALDEIKKITDSNPAFKSLSAPEIMQKLYGNLSDDAKSKLSTALDSYGLKGVNISELEGDALVDAINKMTAAFQNKAFDNLDIDENAIKGIMNVLQRNASLISAKEQLEMAVDSRRRYLDGSKYTTQGRTPGTARTKTDNVYDILKSNEPLSVQVVNGDKSWVASVYNPKGAPGQADKSYKATSYGFNNFLYESGIKNEMAAIVEASIRETYLDNISKRLESWSDGYKPSQNEITQMFDSLGDDLKPGDYIDEDGVVIEVDELRAYVKKQREDMVTARQLLDELIASGKIRVALGKDAILPDFAKDTGKYAEIKADVKKQADKEVELENTIGRLKTLTIEDQAKRMQSAYNSLNDANKSSLSTILSGHGLKDIDIAKLDGKDLTDVFVKIKTALSNESELESLISNLRPQNPKDEATKLQSGYISSFLNIFHIDETIANLETKLVQLREIRAAQEQEVDRIIAIDNDVAVYNAKADHVHKKAGEASKIAGNLSRYGNKSNYYKNATNKEKHKYEYGRISIDELLENINFAKIYGIGDTSVLEEAVSVYHKAVAEQRNLEESGATDEALQAGIDAVNAAEQELINKYFGTDGWYVTKYLREQFASIDTQNEGGMQSVQRELDAETQKQNAAISEIEKAHLQRVEDIGNQTTQMLSTYIDSTILDINAEKSQRENAIADKRKDIERQIMALDTAADKDPRIAKLREAALKSHESEEYKALNSTYQKAATSNNPNDKKLAKTYKEQLEAYDADYHAAKERWIKTRTTKLNKELQAFIQSIEQGAYPKANEHADKIEAKRADIEAKRKALTTEVNKDDEIKRLKANRDSLKRKIKAADDIGDVKASRELKQKAFEADERYRIAKDSWIVSRSAALDKELLIFIEGLEAEGRSVEKFNTNLAEGETPVTSAQEIRAHIQERNAKLLQEENDRFKQELEESTSITTVDQKKVLEERKGEIERDTETEKQKAIDRVTKNGQVMTDSQFMASQYELTAQAREKEAEQERKKAKQLETERVIIQSRSAINDDIIAERKAALEEEKTNFQAPTSALTDDDVVSIGSSSSGGTQYLGVLDVTNLTADSMSVNGDQGGILGLLGQIAKEETLSSILAQLSKGIKTTSGGEGASGGKGKKKEETEAKTVLSDGEALSRLQEKIKTDYPEFASVSNSRAVSGGHAIDVFQYKNLDKIKETRAEIERLNNEGKAGTEEWNVAQQHLNALLSEQEKITLKINTTTGEITTKSSFQNLAIGAKAASKELQNVDVMMSQLQEVGILSFGANGEITSSNQAVQNYLNSLRQLQVYKDGLSQDALFDPSTQQQLSNLTLATQNYRKEVMVLLKDILQLNSGAKIGKLTGGIVGLDDSAIKKSMQELVAQSTQLETTFGKLTPVTNELGQVVSYQLTYTLRTGKREVQEMTAALNPLTGELRVQKGAIKEVATGWDQFWSGLKGKAASIMQYLISITSIHDVFRYFSQGVQYVREIDSALTELKKVTDETDASYRQFLQDMASTGSVIGATVSDLTTMAAEWSRLGYSMSEAATLAESTAILLNVSEFQDATSASEALISTMQAFQYTADESMHVVDILNEVGNNYAVSSDGIATALQDSASALMEAGNNLEQSVALVAAANKVVQDPNSVGSALRTISLRLRGTSVEILEEMGEETDGVVESISKMQEKIKALTGVDILTDSGAYKETYEILYEIGQVWNNLENLDRSALLELMAGKNRANTLAAILNNMDDLKGAYETALNAEGSALKENVNQLDSIQGRITLFTNSLQTMWMNFIDSDAVKIIVDMGTAAIKLVDALGLLPTVIGGFSAFKTATKDVKANLDAINKSVEQSIAVKQAQTAASEANAVAQATENAQENAGVVAKNAGVAASWKDVIATNAQTAATKTLAVAKGILTGITKGVVIMIASQVIGKAFEWIYESIDKAVHRAEYLKKEVEELEKTYEDAKKTFSENLTELTTSSDTEIYATLEDEFKRLTRGVDEYGNNISLTSDQYERYKDICEKIVGISPEIAKGYDSATKAIGNNASALSQLIELQKMQARQNVKDLIKDENLDKIAENAYNNISAADEMSDTQSGAKSGYDEQLALSFSANARMNGLPGSQVAIASLLDGMGYDSESISKILDKYFAYESSGEMVYYLDQFFEDYIDEIYANKDKLSNTDMFSFLNDFFAGDNGAGINYDKFMVQYDVQKIQNQLQEAKNGLIDTLLQIPHGEEAYDNLNDGSKSFIIEWIKNSKTFKIDPNATEEEVEQQLESSIELIQKIVNDFASDTKNIEYNGKKISAKELFEQFNNLDTSSMNWREYEAEINKMLSAFYFSLDEATRKQIAPNGITDLASLFGIDFAENQTKLNQAKKQLASYLGQSQSEIMEYVNNLTAKEFTTFLSIDWNEYGTDIIQNWQDVMEVVRHEMSAMDNVFSVKTYSALSESVASYNDILKQTSEIVVDNTEVTQEYKDALVELGISESDLAECFDENNPLVVKNANALNNLVKDAKKTTAQNIKLAKSQARLKYYEKYKELQKLTNGQKVTTAATMSQVKAIYAEMTALQKSISRYSMLEHQLLGATNAYEKFAEAQEIDAANDYESKAEELVGYLADAFQTGKLGTESAQAAIMGLVPESVYEDLDTLDEKMAAVYDYFTTDLSKYFYVKFNDDGSLESAEMLVDNVKQFVEDGITKGAFTGSWEEWDLDDSINSLDDLAEQMNVTKEVAYAFLQAMETYDISWIGGDASTLLDKLIPSTTEIQTIKDQIQEAFDQTPIDLTARLNVSAEKLEEEGYTSSTTIFNSGEFGLYNEDGSSFEILATPVLPNGDILGKDEFTDYIKKELASGKSLEEIDVFVGAYADVETAKEAAQTLDEALKYYYDRVKSYNLENAITSNIQKQAELEYKIGTGQIEADTIVSADGVTTASQQLSQLREESEANAKAARENITAWTEANKAYEDAKKAVEDCNKALKNANKENDPDKIAEAQTELEKAEGTLWDTYEALVRCGEPTEVILTFAMDQVQKDLKEIKDTMNETELGIVSQIDISNLEKDKNGKWIVDLEAYSNLDETSKAKVQQYIDYLAEEHNINILQGEGATTTLDVLTEIKDILSQTYTLMVETSDAETKTKTFADIWNGLKDKTVTLTQNVKQGIVSFFTRTPDEGDGVDVNGTAHIGGTAHAGGSWGAPKTETALTGELGPEILVRNGRWTTVGENGAEFTQVKKGDIIFNHKQSEQLLKHGYVTGRGKAYASGTAYKVGSIHPWLGGMGNIDDDWENITPTIWDTATNGEYLEDAADSMSDAADEFREVFDWIAIRLEEINDDLELKSAQLENKVGATEQNKVIDQMINDNKKLLNNLTAGSTKYYSHAEKLLSKIPDEYQTAAQDGAIAIEEFVGEVDEKTLEAIKEYREWVQKGDDAAKQAEETLTEISNLARQAIENVAQDYDNKNSIPGGKQEQLDAYNELAEVKYGSESAQIYEEKIKINDEQIGILEDKRDGMQKTLDEKVKSGEIEKYSQAWYDSINDIAAVDTEILNLKTDTENYQDAINDIKWEHFDNEISRIQVVSDEADNLIDILSDKDMVTDDGEWTEEGITSLGLYAQKMDAAEQQAKKYADAIEGLEEDYKNGKVSEMEYQEKLEELKDGQYDAIKSYQDSKDAIVDLNKERIDAIKNGIEEEIEAYDELIETKKEELDAEKDLYDFQKKVRDSSKDIADIERQLAALAGDNSASARAKRAQLEAELAEKKSEQEDMYYERSIENQQKALDKEQENFQEAKEQEMEDLDEYLEDTEQVVTDSTNTIQDNSDVVAKTLADTEDTYGLDVNSAITSPWKDGANAISEYTEQFGDTKSSTMNDLDEMSDEYKQLENKIESFGDQSIEDVQSNFEKYQAAVKQKEEKEEKKKDNKPADTTPTIKVGGNINAGDAKIYEYAGDKSGENQYYSKDPKYKVLAIDGNWVQVRHHSLKSGVTGWFKKSDVKAYAKGSKGVDEDQLALIDELGEELILRAQNGRLTYMEKGTGIIPADLTSNLMEWGKLDPSIMLDQNRPSVGVHPEITNTEIQIDNSIAELIHIEHCDQSTLPDVEKIVNKALEKHTQKLNQSLRKYAR